MYKNLLSILILFVLIPLCKGQDVATESLVKGFFTNPEQVQWIKQYEGQMDASKLVSITLASDGYQCKGILKYSTSKEILKLEGIKEGSVIRLEEKNKSKATSGFIYGNVNDGGIKAEWSNLDGSISSSINLQESNGEVDLKEEDNNKWVRRYKGIIKMDEVDLILHQIYEGEIEGSAFIKQTREHFRVRGSISESGQMELNFKNLSGMSNGILTAKILEDNTLRASFKNKSGEKQYASFELRNEMQVACVEYADYKTSYEIVYPVSEHANFNKWMESHLKSWMTNCRGHVGYIKKSQPKGMQVNRSMDRAYVWFEMESISDKIISGDLVFSNTWTKDNQGLSLNYDLELDAEIQLYDLVRKSKDFDVFLKDYIRREIKRNPRYMQKDFRNYIKNEDFPVFTIGKTGINFCTVYDAVYGKTEVTIPYRNLQPYMKSKNPIGVLLSKK